MTTSVQISHPAISRLCNAVEQKYGKHITQGNIESFASQELGAKLSSDTLRQLWGYRVSNYKTTRRTTLDILSQYVGDADWDNFVVRTQGNNDSGLKADYGSVSSSAMEEGQIIRISWQPDRVARLRYMGNESFQIVEVTNSSFLQEGDQFECCQLLRGETAILSNLMHNGKNFGGYRIGIEGGISSIEFE